MSHFPQINTVRSYSNKALMLGFLDKNVRLCSGSDRPSSSTKAVSHLSAACRESPRACGRPRCVRAIPMRCQPRYVSQHRVRVSQRNVCVSLYAVRVSRQRYRAPRLSPREGAVSEAGLRSHRDDPKTSGCVAGRHGHRVTSLLVTLLRQPTCLQLGSVLCLHQGKCPNFDVEANVQTKQR